MLLDLSLPRSTCKTIPSYFIDSMQYSYSPILLLSVQPSQVGSLFTFLARQGAKYRAGIRVDEHVYDQVRPII